VPGGNEKGEGPKEESQTSISSGPVGGARQMTARYGRHRPGPEHQQRRRASSREKLRDDPARSKIVYEAGAPARGQGARFSMVERKQEWRKTGFDQQPRLGEKMGRGKQ